MSRMRRIAMNIFGGRGRLAAWFPPETLEAIHRNVEAGEREHAGEIVFVVEARLPIGDVLDGVSSRERAEALFAEQRVWDTEANTGVLIYVLLAEHKVEVVADRGIARAVEPGYWQALCAALVDAFRAQEPRAGVLAALDRLHATCRAAFPADGANRAELSDRPIVL